MRLIDTNGDNAKIELSKREIGSIMTAFSLSLPAFMSAAADLAEADPSDAAVASVNESLEVAARVTKTLRGIEDVLTGPDDHDFRSLLVGGPFEGWKPDDGENPIGISA